MIKFLKDLLLPTKVAFAPSLEIGSSEGSTSLESSEAIRKLASIQKITSLDPIEGADRIELATVNGWQTIVKKGEFKKNQLGVYFEIDSLLPMRPEYEFLKSSSYRAASSTNPEGYRLKSMRLRKQLSQGLMLPLEAVGLHPDYVALDQDVTDLLGVKKWQVAEASTDFGQTKGSYTSMSNKTDEPRIQSSPKKLEQLNGKPYFITEKLDGSSMTVQYYEDEMKVYTRRFELESPLENESSVEKTFAHIIEETVKPDETPVNKTLLKSGMWDVAIKLNVSEKLKKYGQDLILKGEYVGPGVQGNKLGLKEHDWKIFTIERINPELKRGERVGFDEFVKITADLGLDTVPILEVGDAFNYSLADLNKKSKGKYASGRHREGIVIRPQHPEDFKNKDFSFKMINNDFLLKEED